MSAASTSTASDRAVNSVRGNGSTCFLAPLITADRVHATATACGVNTICRDEGSEETGGPVTPDGIYCAVTGGTGTGGTHTWYVSAVDSLGNETILGNSGNSSGCTNTPGTYDSSHYETITWLPSPGAASYT